MGIAANVSDVLTRKNAVKNALDSLEKDKLAQKEMEEESKRVQKLYEEHDNSSSGFGPGDMHGFLLPVMDTLRGVAGGTAVGIATGITEVTSTTARGVSVAGTVAKVFSVGAVAVSVITVPLDIWTIANATTDIIMYEDLKQNCDAAERIAKLITKLEAHRDEVSKFCKQLEAADKQPGG